MLEPDKQYLLLKATSTDYNDLACLAKSAATKFSEPDLEKHDELQVPLVALLGVKLVVLLFELKDQNYDTCEASAKFDK